MTPSGDTRRTRLPDCVKNKFPLVSIARLDGFRRVATAAGPPPPAQPSPVNPVCVLPAIRLMTPSGDTRRTRLPDCVKNKFPLVSIARLDGHEWEFVFHAV